MPRKHAKRINPRRVPIAKSAIDKDAILAEAMKDDMYHAWLLVVYAIIELEAIEIKDIPLLADKVNRYVSKASFHGKSKDTEMSRAERLMGIRNPYENLNPDVIKSKIELDKFKSKVIKVATHTALCVICLGLEASGTFDTDDLRRLFFNVDLTLAEIDSGRNSYGAIEEILTAKTVQLEVYDDEYSTVNITI